MIQIADRWYIAQSHVDLQHDVPYDDLEDYLKNLFGKAMACQTHERKLRYDYLTPPKAHVISDVGPERYKALIEPLIKKRARTKIQFRDDLSVEQWSIGRRQMWIWGFVGMHELFLP